MTNDLFNLVLQTATFDGEVCYNNTEEMDSDYKINKFVSLDPTEIKRLVFTAYQFGKNGVEVKENENNYRRRIKADIRKS